MSDELYQYLDQVFEWDTVKARKNWLRHHVLFTEAATVFFDKNVVIFTDEEHSSDEQRYTVLGQSRRAWTFTWFMWSGMSAFALSALGQLLQWKGDDMKASWEDDYEMPDEIDFSKLKRIPTPFFQEFRDLNLIALDNDVAAVFPDSEAVNAALRSLIKAARAVVPDEMKKAS